MNNERIKCDKVLRCKKCGKEIRGGFYNTPNGAYCCDCWSKTPQRIKDKALNEALKKLASVGNLANIILK